MWTIKMKTTSAGPDGVKQAGKEYQVTPEEGKQLVPIYADLVSKNEPKEEDGVKTLEIKPEIEVDGKVEASEIKPDFPKLLSPGRWELSNGKIIQGKKVVAIEAENALKG